MDDAGWFAFAPDGAGGSATLWVEAAGWLAVLVACLVAVRQPWAWAGVAGGLVGSVAAVALLADYLMQPSGGGWAYIVDNPQDVDWPGFVTDLGLQTELVWARALGTALVAVAFVTGAVLSRRARTT